MIISDVIEKEMREAYQKGATQTELAKKFGVTQQHICDLLSGKRKFNKLELSTIQKMFPDAQIELGVKNSFNNNSNSTISSNSHNNFLSDNQESNSDNLQSKIKEVMKDESFTSEEKLKIIDLLMR